jgi:hypothetical protein
MTPSPTMNAARGASAASLILIALSLSAAAFSIPSNLGATSTGQPTFQNNLQLHDAGSEVLALQKFLNAQGFLVAQTGAGSPGDETTFFGLRTYQALVRYQKAHGLPPTGFFGPMTRGTINSEPVAGNAPSNTATSSQPSIPLWLPTITSLTFGSGGEGGGGGPAPDTTPPSIPPSISLIVPESGATIGGSSVTLTATASDNVAVANVQFEVDGTNIGSAITSSPYTTTWNSTGVLDGSHTLYAVAEDTSGNYATSSIAVTVDNTAPSVSMTDPTNGSTVSDTINLEATASDNGSVAGVQFQVDGTDITPEITLSPYSLFWDTTSVIDGTHTIQAVARDTAGNRATSTPITVTVDNSASGPTEAFSDNFTSSFSSELSFTRTTSAWDYNSSGVVTSFASGTPMLGVYPNAGTTNEGVGIWTTRTNQCLGSESPTTQTRSITVGAWIVSMTGSGSVAVSGAGGTGIGGTATSGTPFIFDATTTVNITFTPSGTVTHLQCERQSINSGVTTADPTPPIVTTSAAVTRNNDYITAPLSTLGVPATTTTYVAKIFIPAFSNTTQVILDENEGTTNNGYRLIIPLTHKPTCELLSGGSVVASAVSASALTANTQHIVGCAFDQTGITVALDGATVDTTQSNMSTAYTTLNIGSLAGGASNTLDGYIVSLAAWNGRLSDTELQSLTSPPLSPSGNFVYLETMGQSNSDGAHATPALTTTPPYPTCAYMLNDTWGVRGAGGDLYTSFQTTGGITGVVPAFETTNEPQPPLSPTSDYGETNVTPWMAQLCSQSTGETYIGRSDGAPGHTIAELQPGTTPFSNAIGEITKVTNMVHAAGGTIKVPAVAWIHGQTDAEENNSASDYYTGELNIINTYATDIKAVTDQSQDPIFFEMQVPQDPNANWDMDIAQEQYDLALTPGRSSPDVRLCAPSYMFPLNPAHAPHYTNTSQEWQGEYLGECYYQEFIEAVPWAPLYPTSITFDSGDHSKIEVALNVPVPPVTIDTTSLAQGAAPDDGLTFTDDCNDATITGVTIIDATHLEVQLSGVPSCSNPMLQNAYTGPGATAIAGAWSNIRDSSTAIGHLTGFHLYNWLVVFSLPVT